MNEPLVVVSDAVVRKGNTDILKGVNFRMMPGEHWVLLGPNGAGKTTLARLISGREWPVEGQVEVLGDSTGIQDPSYLASRVGVASADVRDRLGPSVRVMDAVLPASWGADTRFVEEYVEEDVARAADLLAALGLAGFEDRLFGTLSEGEKQRVSIARALMADPEMVVLDEPTAGLDLGARETLLLALTDIMADPATPGVVLITHELEEIPEGFTHVALLQEGRLAKQGPIEQMLTDDNLSEVFGLPLQVDRRDGRWWASAKQKG